MRIKQLRKVALFVVVFNFILLSCIPVQGAENPKYKVEYDSPKYEKTEDVDIYPPVLYELLKDINVEADEKGKFSYSNEVSFKGDEGEQFVWSGDRIGRISMEGKLVQSTGNNGNETILYGTMSFYIESTYVSGELKSVEQFTFEGPFYIPVTKEGQVAQKLYIGEEPKTNKKVHMKVNRVDYDKNNKEVYNQTENNTLNSSFEFHVSGDIPDTIVQNINEEASEKSGETSNGVLSSIVVAVAKVTAIAGLAAGVGATVAGAASGSGGGILDSRESDNEESSESAYKMIVYKDFGDKIKLNADPVFVYARMIEVNCKGVEIERPDLTSKIEIFSSDAILEIGANTLSGQYMGASVYASGLDGDIRAEAIISFKFTGEGGVFQNNVKFKVIGEARIELSNKQLFILSNSGRSFELSFALMDFTLEPEITVRAMGGNEPFQLEVGKNKKGENIIIATDKGEKKNFQRFFQSYTCEITAENEKEYARNIFHIEVCNEGILPDFLGKPKAIRGYRVSLDSDEMEETLFDVKLGVWNEEKNTLEFIKPLNIDIELTDDKNIFELIGVEIKPDENSVLTDRVRYIAKAKTNFPSTKQVEGKMYLSTVCGEKNIDNEIEISLLPDILEYERDIEKEYEACKRIIEIYMAPRFRGEKLYQLEKVKFNLGLEDLREFRKRCWRIAEQSIIQEGQEYLKEAAWYDEAIAYADLMSYMGDIAFELALAPIGGPITGFIAGEIKAAFIEVCVICFTSPDKGLGEQAMDYATKRLVNAVGAADGLISIPDKTKPKELTIWLTCYTIYRIGYHKRYDKNDNNEPISIIEAVEKGLMDFVGKGAGVLLGDFLKEQGKGRWVEKISVTDKDQAIVDDAVSKVARKSLDVMDKVAEKGDDIIEQVLKTLMNYINKLKIGG